jgi:hypothetical protein
MDAATCGTASSFQRGFVGEQNSRPMGTISTGGEEGFSKSRPHAGWEPLGGGLGRWLDGTEG